MRSQPLAIHTPPSSGSGALCALPVMARMDGGPAATEDKNMVMYLGNVQVRGQEKITKTLQAIKVALDMPYSNDPKLADMMVCRLEEKAGSHVQQILICGTNHILSKQRAAMQLHHDHCGADSRTALHVRPLHLQRMLLGRFR